LALRPGAKIKHLTATARLGAGYDHDIVGFNYRMTNLQAAVGVAQLERLDEFLQAKARIAQTYASAFGDTAGLLPFPALPDRTGSHWLSGIFAPDASLAQMENLRSSLIENGVEARSFWKPIHLQQPYLACPRHLSGLSDALWQRIQPLPCSTQLTQSDQMRVIDLVNRAFR
jgi:perosamine synthetase